MASLYRRTWKDDAGRTVEAGIWTAEVKVGDAFKRLPGFRDRKVTEEFARKVEKLAELRAIGETPDASLTSFLDTLPKKQRRKLLDWGLLDDRAAHESTALLTHLDDFRQTLRDRDATPIHVDKTYNRIKTILDALGATTLRTLTADKVSHYLAERRKLTRSNKGLSANSSNHYLGAIKAFCAWMLATRRAKENPLATLNKVNADKDRRHVRRVLQADEIGRLLKAAKGGPERFGMSGEARFWLYKLALETGLRAGELRSLTRASFDLGDAATVTIDAAHAKNREAATLPLRADTADGLRTFLAGKLPAARVFALPRPENIVVMLRGDLKKALIAERDESKRVLDFHSLRKTFASLLLASGVDLRTAKDLMRHSSITLTADVYAVSMRGSQANAVAMLPSMDADAGEALANGTDGGSVCAGGQTGGKTGGNRAPNGSSRFAHVRENAKAEPLRNIGKTSVKRGSMLGNSESGESEEKVPPREVESLSSG